MVDEERRFDFDFAFWGRGLLFARLAVLALVLALASLSHSFFLRPERVEFKSPFSTSITVLSLAPQGDYIALVLLISHHFYQPPLSASS